MSRTEMVREFHAANGFPIAALQQTADACQSYSGTLLDISERALASYRLTKTDAFMRAHLMAEELGEAMSALSTGDRLGLLDALADLSYVVDGTAVAFGLPLEAAFREVHLSNMTKQRVTTDKDGDRLRRKGPHYIPPDLQRVLDGKATLLMGLNCIAKLEGCTILELLRMPINATRIDGCMNAQSEIPGRDAAWVASAVKAKLLGGRWQAIHEEATR